MTLELPGGRDHPAWLTVLGTFLSYGVILAVILALMFVVPYLAFSAL